jgi:hypothetical protein
LGIKIVKNETGFCISQPNFIVELGNKFGLSNAKLSKYPLDPGYYKLDGEKLDKNTEYRQIVGSLLYIANCTRPDISASVSILSRKVENPKDVDLLEARRVIKYLLHTKDLRLHMNFINNKSLLCYVDADWGEDRTDRKSQSGYVVYVC